MISEGLKSREINKRAAKHKPPYKVSRQQVDFYRKSRGVKLDEIEEASESQALKTGFALREKRVEALDELAGLLHQELTKGGRRWLPQVKLIGSGRQTVRVDYEVFNRSEVDALFKALDELAKETGGRNYQLAAPGGDDEDLSDEDLAELSDEELEALAHS